MPKEECMWPFGKYKAFPCAVNHLTLEMKMCQKRRKKKEITTRKKLLEHTKCKDIKMNKLFMGNAFIGYLAFILR